MIIVTFKDGTACRFGGIDGPAFEPHDGERYLFEFPEGEVKKGTVWLPARARLREGERLPRGVYHRDTRTITVEV